MEPNVDALLREVFEEARREGIPVSDRLSFRVVINRRAKTRFGCCKQQGERFVIELAERVLAAGERACRETLAHEVLHTCPGCRNHGARWKAYAARMNSRYGYHIARLSDPQALGVQREEQAAYRLRCEDCGRTFERMRASRLVKRPDLYRCPCGGRIRRLP